MFSSRAAARGSRSLRLNNPVARSSVRRYADAARPQSERSGLPHIGSSGARSGGSSPFLGGFAGGAAASLLVFGLVYKFSGIGKASQSLHQAKSYFDSAAEQVKIQFKEKTPDTNEAIETLKESAYKYAMFVPGGREYVDKVFKDIDIIRKKHGEQVDNIVQDAYSELRDASQNGLSLETFSQSWSVLSKCLQRLSSLAVDAGQDILDNHPEIKNKIGGSFDQLKEFGDNFGPEAKEQVEQTYKEIQDVVNQGIRWDTIDKVRKLAQDKVHALKKMSDQAWKHGYEQIQPLLKNNPQAKQMVEENLDTLKNGNVTQALSEVKQALTSGDMSSLNKYIQSAKQKAEQYSSGNGISNWLRTIPGGSQILPQLQKLQQVAQSQSPEAEKLAKDTIRDIKQVLDKRSAQAEELYKKAQKEVEK